MSENTTATQASHALRTAGDEVAPGLSSVSQRMYLIAQLDGHYGRFLRERVLSNYEDTKKLLAHDDERFMTKQVALEQYLSWLEELVDLAREGAEALEAARQCPDEFLDDLVRWQTNPNWREAMIRAGMEFDTQTLRWREA